MLYALLSAAPSLSWLQADDDLFVATRNGEYAGFVSRIGPLFEAHSGRGDHLGSHGDAGDAAAALEVACLQPA